MASKWTSRWTKIAAALILWAAAGTATAEDFYHKAGIRDLKFADGASAPEWPQANWRQWQQAWTRYPYIVLDGPGEAYVDIGATDRPWSMKTPEEVHLTFHIRADQKGDVAGRLYYPKSDWSGMTAYRFTLPAATANTETSDAFQGAKADHYHRLLARNLPGAAWFRHEIRQAEAARGNRNSAQANAPAQWSPSNGDSRLAETYDLLSGGRAISENLQLDRRLAGTQGEAATEDVDKIDGITIAEIDWKPLIKDLKPKLDPLASLIPADQHAVFFPTFSAAVEAIDQAEQQGTPVLYLAEPRSEDAGVKGRYQRQLGLSLSGLGRLLGPHVARSVAITGSDVNFRTGTDVALLFETPNPAMLENLLATQIAMSAAKSSPRPLAGEGAGARAANLVAEAEQGEIDGLHYRSFRSLDRKFCSYFVKLDHAVVVTNSPYQIKRLAAVVEKKTPVVASLPEYIFYRDRYRLDDPEETAFVFLSDATIRRWCGPRWRIASSRQLQDLGVMAELQAANMDRLAKNAVQPGPIYTDFATADAGQWRLDADGVHSSVQGSLEFMTPIAEIPMEKVTRAEADAYRWWRDGYQRNWRWAFDPIGIRLTMKENRLAADLTVMPLIWNNEYRELQSLSQGAALAPSAGDPHDALAHFALALNTKSPLFHTAENFISTMSHGVTLGWIGSSVAVYADDDPIWQDLAKTTPDQLDDFMGKNAWRLPVGVRVEVSNGLKLTVFLAAFRAYVDQTAPGMTHWESLSYKDQPYVKITPTERAKGQKKMLEKASIYYAATGDALLVTLSENLLKRAIDRQLAAKNSPRPLAGEGSGAKADVATPAPAWLGSNVALRVDRRALELLSRLNRDDYQRTMQLRAWSNLPILNEWHRLYPDQDPVALHQRVWKIGLLCPGGGRYVWNEKFQTMESTVYGHPGEPKPGPAAPPALMDFARGAFGLSFENQGLRARVSLERDAEKTSTK